jgi:hypothetical protein
MKQPTLKNFLKKISHPVHTSPLHNIKYQTAVNQIIPTGPPTFEKPENTFYQDVYYMPTIIR